MLHTLPESIEFIFSDNSKQILPPQWNNVHHWVHGSIVRKKLNVRWASLPIPGAGFSTVAGKMKALHRKIPLPTYIITVRYWNPVVVVSIVIPQQSLIVRAACWGELFPVLHYFVVSFSVRDQTHQTSVEARINDSRFRAESSSELVGIHLIE